MVLDATEGQVPLLGCTLAPFGFLGRNPTLDVPPPATAHCAHGADDSAGPA